MLQPSEVTATKLLPTIRARVAQHLIENHGMKQVAVAKALGITQAAVSHYNTKSRGLDKELLHRFPEIDRFSEELASGIASGMSQTDQIARINEFCAGLMGTPRFCEYHKSISDIDPNCAVCFPPNGKP